MITIVPSSGLKNYKFSEAGNKQLRPTRCNKNMKAKIFQRQWLLAIMVIFTAMAISVVMFMTRPIPEKKAAEIVVQQVKVAVLQPEKIAIPVLTQGVVEPRTKIKLQAEVNGKIYEVSPRWLNGGFFRKNDQLLKIEDYYYQNQLARAKATLAQAKSGLVQEEGFSYVAKQEWEKRNQDENNSSAKSLALREPQLQSARAQFESASADVVSAQNALDKTFVQAPFDGVIVNKMVDIGQFVNPGLALAELHAIDVVEIRVPLTEAQQAYLDLPDLNQIIKTPALIKYATPNGIDIWQGNFVRTEGVLDPLTKVLNGVVQVKDPYGLDRRLKTPLRLGTFVEVELKGKQLDNIFVIPRRFLFAGNTLWLVDKNNRLQSRIVKVLPVREENVYVHEGLQSGDRLIVSGLVSPLDGAVVEPVVVNIKAVAVEPE